MAKEIPIFKPGAFGKFSYYFFEILNTIFLVLFTMGFSVLVILYFWSLFDFSVAAVGVASRDDGPWTFWYQFQNVATILFLWLFIFMLKQNLKDLFSPAASIEIKIDKKGIDGSGNLIGSRTCYIAGGDEAFTVTQKVYDALQEGDLVRVKYTKAQRNVRTITLLKR